MDKLKITTILGSLRKDSFNKRLLNYIIDKSNDSLNIEIANINLPLFNEDIASTPDQNTLDFRKAVKDADGILFVTPEYNYSIPGVLKNAIDWGANPEMENVFLKKPIGIAGTSSGMSGTSRSQLHLRQVCVFLNAIVMPKPEVLITYEKEKFDESGALTDTQSKEVVDNFIESFTKWVDAINKIKDSL